MKNVLYIFIVFLFFSCRNDFQEHSSGLEYRFIEENPQAKKPSIGDGLVILLKYTTENDSVLFDGPFRVRLEEPSHKGGSIEDAFALMHLGDSAEFQINAKNFIRHTIKADIFPEFIKTDSKLKFYVRLKEILSPQEMEQMQAQLDAQNKAAETMLLDDYIEKNEITTSPTQSGLIIIPLQQGKGKAAKQNDSLIVHYTGMFLDGTIFDSSVRRNEPFGFVLGKNQVIPAWEEALATMKIGDKIRLISPSALAYGKKGFGELIPPFSTLIFEVELLDIK